MSLILPTLDPGKKEANFLPFRGACEYLYFYSLERHTASCPTSRARRLSFLPRSLSLSLSPLKRAVGEEGIQTVLSAFRGVDAAF